MELSIALIQAGCGATEAAATAWLAPLQAACDGHEINTPLRVAAFLAQVGYESEYLMVLTENLDYGAAGLLADFPDEFDEAAAAAYARQPEKIANRAYAGKYGNGDEVSGDGWKYRGRGLIQITFHDNYALAALGNDLPLLDQPDLLLQPANAALSAAWWWSNHNLNALADTEQFSQITRVINGPALAGNAQRLVLYAAAKQALGIT